MKYQLTEAVRVRLTGHPLFGDLEADLEAGESETHSEQDDEIVAHLLAHLPNVCKLSTDSPPKPRKKEE